MPSTTKQTRTPRNGSQTGQRLTQWSGSAQNENGSAWSYLLYLLFAVLVILGFCSDAHGQGNPNTTIYPINDESLLVASNAFRTVLDGAISASTLTITVDDASKLITPGAIIVDSEAMVITSKVADGLGGAPDVLTVGETSGSPAFPICAPRADCRGFDQGAGASAPTSHVDDAPVRGFLLAHHLNQERVDFIALRNDVPLCTQESELTIDVAGSITIPHPGCFKVDTFNNDPTDDLASLVCPLGTRFILMAEDDARTIVIKSGASFLMRYDQPLDSVKDSASFLCRTADVATRTGRSDGG